MELEVTPFVGVGPLKFGMARDQVGALMGDPDEMKLEQWPGGEESEYWKYIKIGLEVRFDSEDGWRAVNFSLSKGGLFGVPIIGMKSDQAVRELLFETNHRFVLSDDMAGIGLACFSCSEIEIDFWAADHVVNNVSVSPKFDKDGNEILWPDQDERISMLEEL